MNSFNELSCHELKSIYGGGYISRCVVAAWGAAGLGILAGIKYGLPGMYVGGIGSELTYMGANGCLG